MKYGQVVKLGDAKAGQVLFRKANGGTELAVVTTIMRQGQTPAHICAARISPLNAGGLVFTSALRHDYWDVSNFAEFRVDLATHEFLNDDARHGDMWVGPDGTLCLSVQEGPQTSDCVTFDTKTGDQVANADPWTLPRFRQWRLVAVDEDGGERATLFSWP